MNAPKLWPPPPWQTTWNVSSGRVLPNLAGDLAAEDRAEGGPCCRTSSVTVLGFGSAESKLFLNFFIRMRMSRVFSSWKL